jgi:hypothetical protein
LHRLQGQAQLQAAGYGLEFTTQASNAALLHMRSMLMRLPPALWVQQQVSMIINIILSNTTTQHSALR